MSLPFAKLVSLVKPKRRWLSEWQRESAIKDMRIMDVKRKFERFSDTVWDLGPRAESLAPDLEYLMATAPLADPKARCYAAFALARFPSHRRAAVDYLQRIRKCGFFESFDSVNLAEDLLQRIEGREPSGPWLFRPMEVGP